MTLAAPITDIQLDTPAQIELYASAQAQEAGIDVDRYIGVLRCESRFKRDAVGDHGTSYGIAQIHLPAHPEVSKEEAMDPRFAVGWSIEKWKENPEIWSCTQITREARS